MNRAPRIVRGPLWLGNGEQGLNAEFDSYRPVAHGKYELRWGTMFSNKDLFIVVGPCDFPTLVVQYCFRDSLAWFRTVDVGVNLPYAGVSSSIDDPKGRVHFLATIGKTMKTVEVTITGIKGLHGEKIEDGFNNASARMELQARHGMILPQTGRMPRELPKFKGYTVDHRLREFRWMEYGKKCEFIPFDSPKGRKLLQEMEGSGRAPQTEAKGGRVDLTEKAITEILDHPFLLDLDEDGYEYTPDIRPSTVRNLMRWHAVDEDEARKLLNIMGRKGFLSEARAWGTRVNAPDTFWRNLDEITALVKKGKWPPRPRPSGKRVPQTEAICPACGGPGMSMGILGRKAWFRCRNCGIEWSRDVTGKRAPQTKGKSGAVPEEVPGHTTVDHMEILYSSEQIKQMARKRGLSTAGSKRDIIKRILG